MTATKKFHLGDLISITDGRLLSPRRIDGVYDLLGHMCGESLFTHQLPLAADAMRPELLLQHPWLGRITAPPKGTPVDELLAWLDHLVESAGEWHEIQPAPLAWGRHDPIQDFHNQWPDKELIVVEMPRESA